MQETREERVDRGSDALKVRSTVGVQIKKRWDLGRVVPVGLKKMNPGGETVA